MTRQRENTLKTIANRIDSIRLKHPLKVAIDGVSAAGKTVFADELAALLTNSKRKVIRASIDGFHMPKEYRYKRGKDSVKGYYYDSFNYQAIIENLLLPLSSGGSLIFREAVFNFKTDSPVTSKPKKADKDSVLLFDGVMLLRPELNKYWDFRIFIRVSFEEVLTRARIRDKEFLGQELEYKYKTRYIPGEKLYLDSVHPEKLADVVVDNSDFDNATFFK